MSSVRAVTITRFRSGRQLLSAQGWRLVGGTVGTAALSVSSMVLNIVTTLVLTRLLGADEYGAFAFALAWAAILSVPAGLGLVPLLIREVAAFKANREWGSIHGVLLRANYVVLASSVVVGAVAASVGWLFTRVEPGLAHPFWIGLGLVPLTALTMVRQSAMQGLGRVVLGRAPEGIVAPGVFLALVLAAWFLLGDEASATVAVSLNVLAFGVAFGVGAILLRRSLPAEVLTAEPVYETRWLRSAGPLLILNSATVAHGVLGTILLGALANAEDAGVYSVALRGALIAGLLSTGASLALMPVIARLQAEGRTTELQGLVKRAGRVVLLASLPLELGLFAFAQPLLGLFGPEFETGTAALRVIVAGEILRLVLGFGALALLMGRRDREVTIAAVAGVVTTGVVDVVLIPLLGTVGAAIGLAVGVVVSAAIAGFWLWSAVGVWAPVLGSGALERGERR